MYTAEIGKIIFHRWRERSGQDITVKQYFDEEFFPLFFDSERYLMLANNSKFDQAYKQKKKKPLTPDVRREALDSFHADVSKLENKEGHLFMGGFSRDLTATTTGQITHLEISFEQDEAYFSWLGLAAGIGVKGGVSLLITDPDMLDLIVEGWKHYRHFLDTSTTLKPHQIDSWNAWWLIHNSRSLKSFNQEDPLTRFPPANSIESKNGVSQFVTPPWLEVLFALTRKVQTNYMMAYIYSLGQTNTSIGFIPIQLGAIQKLSSLYEKLFGIEDFGREGKTFEQLYNTAFSFFQACRMGAIGLRAIEPKDLRKYMIGRSANLKNIKVRDNNNITFKIYQTWITAMLNNEELLLLAQRLATALSQVGPSKRGKRGLSNAVENVLEAKGRKQLIDALANLIADEEFKDTKAANDLGSFDHTVDQITKMPATNVPLFITLLRFKYAFQNL